MHSSGFTVKRIVESARAVVCDVNNAAANQNPSMISRRIRSEPETKAGEITEYAIFGYQRAVGRVVVESFVFGDQ